MRLTVQLSVREHGYLAALAIAIVQRTLLKGVDWQDALLPFAGFLSLVLDGVMLLLLAASFLTDVLKRRRLHHLIAALTLGLLAVSAATTRQTELYNSGMPCGRVCRLPLHHFPHGPGDRAGVLPGADPV